MSNTKKALIRSGLLVFALLTLSACTQDQQPQDEQTGSTSEQTQDQTDDGTDQTDDELTPEQVLAQMDEAEGVGTEQGPITVEIISPEEPTFEKSQARFWKAQVDDLVTGSRCYCDWKFYLNEYEEEVLYEQMDDRQCTGTDEPGQRTCGFSSTFIESRGELRVTVDVEVTNYQGEVLQTASAQQKYTVL